MDIEKLIHCLQCCARVDAHNIGCDDCGLEYCGPECQQLCGTAATALSTLQAENEKLRAELDDLRIQWDMYGGDVGITAVYKELEQVKAERDAAVKDLNEFLAMDELCPIQCEWCKWNGTYCDGKTPEWRGIKEDWP